MLDGSESDRIIDFGKNRSIFKYLLLYRFEIWIVNTVDILDGRKNRISNLTLTFRQTSKVRSYTIDKWQIMTSWKEEVFHRKKHPHLLRICIKYAIEKLPYIQKLLFFLLKQTRFDFLPYQQSIILKIHANQITYAICVYIYFFFNIYLNFLHRVSDTCLIPIGVVRSTLTVNRMAFQRWTQGTWTPKCGLRYYLRIWHIG